MERGKLPQAVWGRRVVLGAGAALTLVLTAATGVRGQNTATPPPEPQAMSGAVSFAVYCSSCHGRGGRGDGPVATALRSAPPDLTTLARRNGGEFPRAQVMSYIDGSRRVPSHGPSDMPVWGRAFRALDASGSPLTVQVGKLVDFIESLQAGPEPKATAAPGRGRSGAAAVAN